jgi:hypothetical protein
LSVPSPSKDKEVVVEYQSAPSFASLMEPVQAISSMIMNVKDYDEVRFIHQQLVTAITRAEMKNKKKEQADLLSFGFSAKKRKRKHDDL